MPHHPALAGLATAVARQQHAGVEHVGRRAVRLWEGDVSGSGDSAMIGVAVSIPQPAATVIDDARSSSGDPLADFIPAHITLLGPTEIDASLFGAVHTHLAAVAARHAPYPVHLRGTGTFRPLTEVVFVAVATGISECERLASAIRSGPLDRELHFPYHPHVTIAHDVPTEALDRVYAEMSGFDTRFEVDHFTFYVHGSDGRWRPLRDFPLRGAVATSSASVDRRSGRS